MSAASGPASPVRTRAAFVERVRVRARRYALWARHLWEDGGASAGQGLAITHGEVDRLLLAPEVLASAEQDFYRSHAGASTLADEVLRADEAAAEDEEWTSLCECFHLTALERDLLSAALAAEIDPGLRRVYAYLHDDVQASHVTQWLAARLFEWAPDQYCGPDANLVFWRLARPIESAPNPWGPAAPWAPDPAIVLLVEQGAWLDPELWPSVLARDATETAALPCAFPESLAGINGFMEGLRATSGAPVEIELVGPARSGRRTLAAQWAALQERDLLVADAGALLGGVSAEAAAERVVKVLRMARAGRAVAYWHAAESITPAAWQAARGMFDVTVFGREAPSAAPPAEGVVRHTVRLGAVPLGTREALWRHFRAESAPAAVRDRLLLAGEVAYLASAADAGETAVRQAARSLARPPNELVQSLPCPYTWADLVVTSDLRAQLGEFEQQARLRWPVYEEWGFDRLCPLGKGITALFAGPSGTGKTMAAQVVARELDLDLYRVDLAGVVNKYIGETEKRLKQVFDHCERAHVLLFFDEADALFGQRMQVKDSHDRFANIEIDYLLQRMEQFDGVAVLATNRKNDLDTAFLRRIRFVIDFLPPGPEERLRLWKKALPECTPSGETLLGAVDWGHLAQNLALTGADIKNAVLSAAFLARSEGGVISMRHLLRAVRREMAKHGSVLRTSWEGE